MSDRTNAALFAKIFTWFASNPTKEHKAWAKELWKEMYNYDFSPYQMYCEEALEILELASFEVNPEYEEEGMVWLYGPKENRG